MEEKLKQIKGDKYCPIALMVRDNKVLTGLRNYTKDKWKNVSVWTFPGGRCDTGETLEQTLRREVQEEVGITTFDIIDFIAEVPGAKEGDTVPIFYCRTEQDFILMEPEKFSRWEWVPIADFVAGSNDSNFSIIARKAINDYLRRVYNIY